MDHGREWLKEFPNTIFGFTAMVKDAETTEQTRIVIQNLALNQMVLETDSPYLVPEYFSKHSKYSNPGMLWEVAEFIAQARNFPVVLVGRICAENARKFYGL